MMRSLVLAGVAVLAAACTQQLPQASGDEMGPMPVVAALYDSGPLPATQDEAEIYFTRELATALMENATSATPETAIDFDYRSWAHVNAVEDIRYRVGQHNEPGRAEIYTAFGYPGAASGMQLQWDMCKRADGQWRIANITATQTADATGQGGGEPVSIRSIMGISETPAAECV